MTNQTFDIEGNVTLTGSNRGFIHFFHFVTLAGPALRPVPGREGDRRQHRERDNDDYPREALAHGWEGVAVAELTIDARGKVKGCRIVQSTGYEVLDKTTCAVIRKRAKFVPDTDDAGRPIPGKVTTPPITWALPH